jgi:hypothetical protein
MIRRSLCSYSYCTGRCLRDFANLADGTQHAAECCVGSRPLSPIKVAGDLSTVALASTSGGINSVAQFTKRQAAHILGVMDSFVEQQCTDSMSRMHLAVYIQPSGLHPLRRACLEMSSFMTRAGVFHRHRQRHSHPGAGRGRLVEAWTTAITPRS